MLEIARTPACVTPSENMRLRQRIRESLPARRRQPMAALGWLK